MTTPILYGSGKGQKEFLTPKSSGVKTRNTNLGYRDIASQRQGFTPGGSFSPTGRYELPPPVRPLVSTGYDFWWQTGTPVTPTGGAGLGDLYIEKYDTASDTTTAQSLAGEIENPPLNPLTEPNYISNFVGLWQNGDPATTQLGSTTHGYKISQIANAVAPPWNTAGNGNMAFWPYASSTPINNYYDAVVFIPFQGQTGLNDKANGQGIIVSGSYGQTNATGNQKIIKVPFATDTYSAVANYETVGSIDAFGPGAGPNNQSSTGRQNAQGGNSLTHGFLAGGWGPNPIFVKYGSVIKFPFANLDVGAITTLTGLDEPWTTGQKSGAGISGVDYGYAVGGVAVAPGPSAVAVDAVNKYPFTQDGDLGSSNIASLSAGRSSVHGSANQEKGYASTGFTGTNPGTPITRIVEVFPFSSDTSISNVGNMVHARANGHGTSEA